MSTTTDWVWLGMSSHIQTCLDLPGVNLVGLRVVWLQ